jgi:glycosyltransferase involved in cell wall biosynthesis
MRIFDVKSLGEVVFESEAAPRADVAVVIPLYNYEQFIIDCLRSVLGQTLERLSIVVVDDSSTDDGPKLAADFLRRHAGRFCSARIIRHQRNQGLSMARNSGVAWSGEPLLFMLDADNRIRPPALARLKSALEIDGADFSYSQLFIFGDRLGVGAADTWHVDRLRFGNTIDAMAMIRRSALIRAGGYHVLAEDHGWEDYDLWCRFFSLGLRGVFVPELLCEYRRHGQSMSNTQTKINFNQLLAEMMLRHPQIFNREV